MSIVVPDPPPSRTDLLERDREGKFTGKMSAVYTRWLAQFVAALSQVNQVSGSLDEESLFGTGSRVLQESGESVAVAVASSRGVRIVEPDLFGLMDSHRRGSLARVIPNTAANIGLYPAAAYPEAIYLETDTNLWRYSAGGAWVQFGTFDDAYGSGWNGSTKAPSQNAVYDKIETLVGRYTPLFDHFTDAGNAGTGEDDLYSDTLAAAQLAANGDKIMSFYSGIFVFSATATRRVRAYFGGTAIFDSGALAITVSNTSWGLKVEHIRVSSSVVRCAVTFQTRLAAITETVVYTEVTGLTLANTQVVKITGEAAGVGAADNDIVAKLGGVAYSKAA